MSNQHLSAIYNFWNILQFVYTLHYYTYCVNNIVYLWNVVKISKLKRHLKLFWASGIPVCQQYKHNFFHFIVPNQLLYPLLYKCCSEIPKAYLIVHTICVMVEGIAINQTNWSMFRKLYMADKCWLDICPIAENGCTHQIGQCK